MKSNVKLGSNQAAKKTGGGVRIFLFILIVLLGGGGAAWYWQGKTAQAKAAAKAGSTTNTATVTTGDVILSASGQGTLVTNEAVNMSFSTSGKVAELKVKLGDMVKKGDVLARLEKAGDLEANLASAQASLLQAQQNLADLQKKSSSTLAAAYQTLVNAQAAYNDALTTDQRTALTRCSPEVFNKYKTALQSATEKVNALMKLDSSAEELTIAGYDYDTALANYSYCNSYTATEKTSAASNLEVAKVSLQEAQDTYNKLKDASGVDPDTLTDLETKVETAQTQVNTAQEALDGITLIAPIDGKITALNGDAGTIVDTSTFLTISDVSHPAVTVSLDETDMDKLVVGNTATVEFTALPGKTFTGKVTLANPQMIAFGPFRAASGQVTLDSQFIPTIEKMQLGLSATVKITGKEARNVLTVPVGALKQLNNGDYVVNLVSSSGQVTQQVVSVGLENSSKAEITGGLKEGDIVKVTVQKTSTSNNQGGNFFFGGGD